MDPHRLRPATRVVALGRAEATPGEQVGAPLVLTSTYHADGAHIYARESNPTWVAFETALGSLEGGDALVFGSGMAAASAALSLLPLGGTVVAAPSVYLGVLAALEDRVAAGTVTLRSVETSDTAAAVAALDEADLLWLESPSNPLLNVTDLAAVLAAARERGVLSVVDNTFATPLLQQPIDLGADLVMHSATKYLSGHSDVILGALVTPPTEAGRERYAALAHHRTIGGAIAGPMEAWLALRGMRTLHLRLDRAVANAAELVSRLTDHPAVERVRYPGFGAMVAIEVVGGADGAERVAAATELWVHSTSLGGVESQLERRRRIPGEPAAVPDNLLRLSVGVEDIEDLWSDLDAALHHAPPRG